MRRGRLGATLMMLAALGGSAAARGEELRLGLDVRGGWESNVFHSSRNEQDDFSVRSGPILMLRRSHSGFDYELRYQPVYEAFLDLSDANGFDHFLRWTGSWRATGRTRLSWNESFTLAHTLTRRLGTLPAGAGLTEFQPEVQIGRQRITRNRAELDLEHDFSPRWQGVLSLRSTFIGFASKQRSDGLSLTLESRVRHALSPRDRVGVGLGVIRQDFTDTPSQKGQSTTYLRGFAEWEHLFDRTFSLRAEAGPSLIRAGSAKFPDQLRVPLFPLRREGGETFAIDPASCPTLADGTPFLGPGVLGLCDVQAQPLPPALAQMLAPFSTVLSRSGETPSRSGNELTLFGRLSLQKRWKTMTASLLYQRTASSIAGTGTSVTLDSLLGRWVWRPAERWRVSLQANASRRKSSTKTPVNVVTLSSVSVFGFPVARAEELRTVSLSSAVDLRFLVVQGRLDRFLSRRARIFALVRFSAQRLRGELLRTNADFDDFRFVVGVRYDLEPWHF